jgi:outer membrane lipoprotein-sorting protein
MKNITLFFLILVSSLGFSQDADAILNRLISKINSVKDYSVDANIRADIPLIKILPVKATIYFKQKDKFKVVSKGIAILPKQGFTDINSFLVKKNSYMAVDGGEKTIDNVKTNLVTVIPTNENSEFVLAKLWIDSKNDLILKSQITTRSSGTVSVDYTYGAEAEFGLPNELVFDLDVKKFKLPKSVAADLNKTEKEKQKAQHNKDQKGTITIKLSNYKINKGLSDEFFQTKNK